MIRVATLGGGMYMNDKDPGLPIHEIIVKGQRATARVREV